MSRRTSTLIVSLALLAAPLAASAADPRQEHAPRSSWQATPAAAPVEAVTDAGALCWYPLVSYAAAVRAPSANAAVAGGPTPAAWHRLLSAIAQHPRG